MINIAYQGGTHGNFLRYFLDKFCSHTPDIFDDPFTMSGNAHKNINYSEEFVRYHPNNCSPYFKNIDQPHIFITVVKDDILFLQRIISKRIGDPAVDFTKDKIKLTDRHLSAFNFVQKFSELYNKKIDETTEIPKYIFRDFFKLNFLNISYDDFISKQKNYMKELPKNVIFFPVSAFWDKNKFFEEIAILDKTFGLELQIDNYAEDIYTKFQNNIKEFSTKNRCNEIINCLHNQINYDLSDIDIFEQAYISAWIEQNFKFILIPNSNYFFKNTKEIFDWIDWYPQHYKAMNPNLPTFNGISNPFYLHKNGK